MSSTARSTSAKRASTSASDDDRLVDQASVGDDRCDYVG